MSFDLYPTENEQALADKAPVMSIEPGAFEGMQWIPNLTMRSFAQAGRAISMAGAVAPILADKVRGGTELQDRYFKQHEDLYQRAVDAWTPKSNEVGTAARVVGDLISTLPMAIAAPPLAILSAQMGTAEDLVRAGVPEGKAQAVGAIQGAGMGLGIWMPILGKNLWQRTVVGGAGFNTLQGVVTRGSSGAILEGTPAEDQFKAFDGEAMTLDVLLGLGFGAFTHINPDARAQGAEAWDKVAKWAERFSPSQKAAIATLREAQHLNVDSTPGKPVAHADIEAHVNRMRTSMDQLANDKPVQVEDMPAPKMEPDPVREQENIQRTADMINIAERIREEEGLPRLDDLNAAGKTVTERLLDLGIPAEEAQSKGLLFDSFFGAMAKHTGSTPEELMARYFGGISKDEGDGAGGMAEGNVDRLHSAIARYLGTENSPFELTPETPADIAARVRDAELAAQGDTEAQQRMQSRAAADVLREHFLGGKGKIKRSDNINSMAADQSAAATRPNSAAAGESGTGTLTLEQFSRIFDESRWLDRGLKVGGKTKLYRGEADADAKLKKIGGSAWATQGRGLYVTTSKSQAKGYGDVRTMTMEDLPKNPIRFRDELAFNEWCGFVARELGFRNVNEFENKVSPFADVWIRKFDPSIDGVQIGTGHGAYFVKFPHEPQSTASAGSEKLFQSAPTFYSELARQVDGLNVKSAPAQGWKDLVKGLVGKGKVKQAEIEATGLDDWLDLQPGKVSKEQVQEFLKNNGVTVEEVELGKSGASADITALERKYPDAVLADASNGKQGPMSDADFQTWQRATRRVRETEPSKFDKYQLPGGENYRELLLTLPPAPLDLPAVEKLKQLPEGYEVIVDRSQPAHEQWGVIPPGQIHARPFAGRYANEAEAIRGALDKLNYEAQKKATDEAYKNQDGQQFRSSHFDQPNILAHVRFNERTDADGKRVLFLEELQSDWAQKGRKEGFALSSEEVERIRGPIRNTYEKYGAWPTAEMMPAEEWAAFNAAQDESDRLNLSSTGKDNRVPSAPFVGKTEAWVALALKRMIRYAAENGFDRVAWTMGEQQAERYDLSKQISRIVLHDNSSGGIGAPKMEGEFTGGNLTAYDHSGQAVIDRRYIQTARELEDQIGKEAAEKLLKATPAERRLAGIGLREKEISGLDLKVGGEGMKGFYDKIVPTVANDVLKKLGGGKVGLIAVGDKGSYSTFDAFENGEKVHQFTARWKAEKWVEDGKELGLEREIKPVDQMQQPGFDITPALREKVMAGQPLFQDNRGYLQFGPGSKMSIGLLASADRSTFLHESGHFFLEVMNDLSKEIPALQGEMETVFKWLGVKDADAWSTLSLDEKRPYHEQWARGFEAYLMDGKAPNERLKSAFARFRDWLIEVYKSAVNLNVTLSDEVRGVMDRMLDSQAAHPSEPPRAPAEGAGTPPPGKVGEAPAARSDLDQALAAGKPNLTAPRGLEHPDIRETLQDMAANETGWAEVGGRMLRIPDASMESGERIDLDLEAYEAAVDRYNVHEDDGLFMAEVRSIIHEAEQQRGAGSQDHPGGAAERGARPGEADPAAESAGQRSAPRDYVSTEAERIATDNPERRVHVGLDADDKPLTVTAREFLDNARKEADRIRQDANLFQIAGECLLSQL